MVYYTHTNNNNHSGPFYTVFEFNSYPKQNSLRKRSLPDGNTIFYKDVVDRFKFDRVIPYDIIKASAEDAVFDCV